MELSLGARIEGFQVVGRRQGAWSSVKPTESSDQGQGRIASGELQPSSLAVAPATVRSDVVRGDALRGEAVQSHARDLAQGSEPPPRSVSGVVSAAHGGSNLHEAHTTVDAGPAQRFEQSEAGLSRRIRHAMDQTLPLGTPAPDPSLFAAARQERGNWQSRTMLLGGRHLTELGAMPEPSTRPEEPPVSHEAPTPRASEVAPTERTLQAFGEFTPSAPGAVPSAPPAAVSSAPSRAVSPAPALSEMAPALRLQAAPGAVAAAEPAQSEGALRASFVRSVGPPTVPPPRRRRSLLPGESAGPDEEPSGEVPEQTLAAWPPAVARSAPAADEADHVAFSLDRPRGPSFPPGPAAEPPGPAVGTTTVVSNGSPQRAGSLPFVRIPDARNPRSSTLSNSVILPPPPQPHDYELTSSPAGAPAPLPLADTARATAAHAAASRAAASQLAASPAAVRAASHPGAQRTAPHAVAAGSLAPALPTTRPPAQPRPSLLDLPSTGGNPLAGYEAPRETFWQRSLIVFVVALAVVGLFALGAIASGFLRMPGV